MGNIVHQNTHFHTQRQASDTADKINNWSPLSLQRTRWIFKFLFSDFSRLAGNYQGSHYANSYKCQLWILFTFFGRKLGNNNPEWLHNMTCNYVHHVSRPGMGNDGRGGWEGVVPVFNLSPVMLSDGAQICAYCVIFRFSPPLHSHYTSLRKIGGVAGTHGAHYNYYMDISASQSHIFMFLSGQIIR